jgi:hypothetical protein
MNGREKSGLSIVVKNPANKAGKPGAEQGERREGAKGNADQTDTYRTPSRAGVSPGLDRVRQAAKAGKETRFTALCTISTSPCCAGLITSSNGTRQWGWMT